MPQNSFRRYRQLERVLLLIELIAPLRSGATVDELTRDVSDLYEDFKPRTIHRDLTLLRRVGLVDVVGSRSRQGPPRWVWADHSMRGVITRHAAEVRTSASVD